MDRNWYTEGNCALPDVSTAALAAASQLLVMKQLPLGELVGDRGTFGAPPAGSKSVHFASCDGSTVSTTVGSGGDLITDVSKVVRGSGGSVRSWWVGRLPTTFTALGVAGYFGWHYNGGSNGQFERFACKTAPTGGTTTARPTSPDEVVLVSCALSDVTTAAHKCHLVTDANGNYFVLICRNGIAHTIVGDLGFLGPQSGDLFPWAMLYQSLASGRGIGGNGENLVNGGGRDTANGFHMRSPDLSQIAIAAEGTGIMGPTSSSWFDRVNLNAATGKLDQIECLIWFYSSTGSMGAVRGKVPDWGLVNKRQAAGTFVLSASSVKEQIISGVLALPCGGTALLFT